MKDKNDFQLDKAAQENGEPSMDSEELEAYEEEQKLVDSMIKKGTMQKQDNEWLTEQNDNSGVGFDQNETQGYEKSKLYKQMRQEFFGKDLVTSEPASKLECEIALLEEKAKENQQRYSEIKSQLQQCDGKIEETKREIEETGTLFVHSKEAVDVIRDFEEMLYGADEEDAGEGEPEEGLAAEVEKLVAEKIRIAKDLSDCLDGLEICERADQR